MLVSLFLERSVSLFFSGSFNVRILLQNVLTQMIFFIFLLSFLTFSMYYKFSEIKMTVFINLFLVIMLTKLTCLRIFFILHISRNGPILHSIVKPYIIFQPSRIILLLYTLEISVLTNSLCIFSILNIIVLNFSMSKVQKKIFNNILLKCKKILKNFAHFFFMLHIWQFNTFFIPMFYTMISMMFLTLINIVLVALIIEWFVVNKLSIHFGEIKQNQYFLLLNLKGKRLKNLT